MSPQTVLWLVKPSCRPATWTPHMDIRAIIVCCNRTSLAWVLAAGVVLASVAAARNANRLFGHRIAKVKHPCYQHTHQLLSVCGCVWLCNRARGALHGCKKDDAGCMTQCYCCEHKYMSVVLSACKLRSVSTVYSQPGSTCHDIRFDVQRRIVFAPVCHQMVA